MNIFFLDKNPVTAAQLQCDKHVVKMTLETAQLLSTAYRRIVNTYDDSVLYRDTHVNHPCSVWTRSSVDNYLWLYEHFCALADEYEYRYARKHKSFLRLSKTLQLVNAERGKTLPKINLKSIPLCMPEECKKVNDPITSYHRYYRHKANDIDMRWTKRNKPEFMENV